MYYAEFVFATLVAMGAEKPEPVPTDRYELILGSNSHGGEVGEKIPGRGGIVTLGYISKKPIFPELKLGLKPCFMLGAGIDIAYATACITKPLHLATTSMGTLVAQPTFGPTLFWSGQGLKERLQFRTSMGLQLKNPDWTVGVGFYHISNARITNKSAGVDVIYGSVQIPF